MQDPLSPLLFLHTSYPGFFPFQPLVLVLGPESPSNENVEGNMSPVKWRGTRIWFADFDTFLRGWNPPQPATGKDDLVNNPKKKL